MLEEEQALESVRKMRAILYALVQEQTRDPGVLAYVRKAGNLWFKIVANGTDKFHSEDPEELRLIAINYLKFFLPQTKMDWLRDVFQMRTHPKTLARVKEISQKLVREERRPYVQEAHVQSEVA